MYKRKTDVPNIPFPMPLISPMAPCFFTPSIGLVTNPEIPLEIPPMIHDDTYAHV